MLRSAEASSTPTASIYSCDAHNVAMSDANDIQLIHVIADPSAEAEMLSWEVDDAESKEGATA